MNEGLREKLEDILKDFQNYVDGLEDEECERPTMDSEDAVEAILEAVVAEIPEEISINTPSFYADPKMQECLMNGWNGMRDAMIKKLGGKE